MLKVTHHFASSVTARKNIPHELSISFTPAMTISEVKRAICATAGVPEALAPNVQLEDWSALKAITPDASKSLGRRSSRLNRGDANDNESVLKALDFNCYTDGRGADQSQGRVIHSEPPEEIFVKPVTNGDVTFLKRVGKTCYTDEQATCDSLHLAPGRKLNAQFSHDVPLVVVINGHAFDQLNADATVAELQEACETVFRVPIDSQALLFQAIPSEPRFRLDDDDGGRDLHLADLATLRQQYVSTHAGALSLCDLRKPAEAAAAAGASVRSWSATMKEPTFKMSFCWMDGSRMDVDVRPRDRFDTVFCALCHRRGWDPDTFRPVFDGRYLGQACDLTFAQLDAEDGDCIEIYVEQCGGMMSVTSGKLGYAQLSKLSVPLTLRLLDGTVLTKVKVTATTTLGDLKAVAKEKVLTAAEEADVDAMSEAEVRALAKSLQSAAKKKRSVDASSKCDSGSSKQPRGTK